MKALKPELLKDGLCRIAVGGLPDDTIPVFQPAKASADSGAEQHTYNGLTNVNADWSIDGQKWGYCDFGSNDQCKAANAQCHLSRQNQDCSAAQGKDNVLTGVQIIMTHPGTLPKTTRLDRYTDESDKNTYFSDLYLLNLGEI